MDVVAAIDSVSGAAQKARLRILHISEAYGGGIASAINDYAMRTPDFEHVLLVAHRRGKVNIGEQLPGLTLHELRPGLPAALTDIRRVVRTNRIDIVHAHSSYAGLYARLALSPKHHPIVYSPHCFAFERTDVATPARAGLAGIERLLAHRTTGFVVVGRRGRELAARIAPDTPTLLVPHVPPATSPPRRRPQGTFRIGAVGRLCPQKDPRFFRDLVVEVRRRHPDVQLEWHWLGDGELQMLLDLQAVGVEVSGWTSRRDAMTAMEGLDLCVLTSAWEEFPFTVVEAATRRVPVLARSIPSLAEEGFPNLAVGITAMADAVAEAATSQVRYERIDRDTQRWLGRYTKTSESVDLASFYLALASGSPEKYAPRLRAVGNTGAPPYSC